MPGEAYLLIACVVVGAAALVATIALAYRVVRRREATWGWRLAGLVPGVGVVAAWVVGERWAAVTWVVFVAAYAGLRYVAG